MIPNNNESATMTILAPSIQRLRSLGANPAANTSSDNARTLLECALSLSPQHAFSDVTIAFLSAFSQMLLAEKPPELKALGFWLRKSKIKQWSLEYQQSLEQSKHSLRAPIGNVLHFTPANVDTMFIYSWVCALVLGNISVIRVSRQESPVKNILLNMLNQLYDDPQFSELASRNVFITYDHYSDITDLLSSYADARILWGGDEAVSLIKQSIAKPKTRDIAFSDRYSVAYIDAHSVSSEADLASIAQLLWKDIEPYQQQACSSPRVLFWNAGGLSEKASQAGGNGTALADVALENPLLKLVTSLNRLASHALSSSGEADIAARNNHLVTEQLAQSSGKVTNVLLSEQISVIEVDSLTDALLKWHGGAGLLYVIRVENIEQALSNLSEKCQTLSYWGVDSKDLIKPLQQGSITSLDRVVPLGQALDFDVIWDGYDLIQQLERKITVL